MIGDKIKTKVGNVKMLSKIKKSIIYLSVVYFLLNFLILVN